MPCSEPHTDEVFAIVTLPNRELHGPDTTADQERQTCIAEFEALVGQPAQKFFLDFWTWPLDDLSTLCVVYHSYEEDGIVNRIHRDTQP